MPELPTAIHSAFAEVLVGQYAISLDLARALVRMTDATAAKLHEAELKHGWRDEWRFMGRDVCQAGLKLHVDKGDPRDVVAYATFCFHHGWPTAEPESAA
jgi:hypothetical protein